MKIGDAVDRQASGRPCRGSEARHAGQQAAGVGVKSGLREERSGTSPYSTRCRLEHDGHVIG